MLTSVASNFVPFRPALEGPFIARFNECVQRLALGPTSDDEVEKVTRQEWGWATAPNKQGLNPNQRRIYRAAWLLFRDLCRAGWQYRWNAGIEVAPPQLAETAESVEEARIEKDIVRQIMRPARQEKIAEAKDFIARMEKPGSGGMATAPVQALIANPQHLHDELSRIEAITDPDQRLIALRQSIQPYLQLVEENQRCIHTSHKLSDIWRYFRFTWSTPAETTPGRTLLYLVRDASRPLHPVMAILSLENSPMRLTDRDDMFGWTVRSFRKVVEEQEKHGSAGEIRSQFVRLLKNIDIAVGEIDIRGLCTKRECDRPSEKTIRKLSDISLQADLDYRGHVLAWRERREIEDEDADTEVDHLRSELGNVSKEAEQALYKRKRAARLAQLLTARREIQSLLASSEFEKAWQPFVRSEEGQANIAVALQVMKNRHVGTSILELNVCGAIPPYSDLLAGKLAAMLALSPQVIADYQARYGGRASDIATRMSGKEVVRPADLLFIGTTSLYRVGASQYNRVRIPAGLLKADAPEVRWSRIGKTSGYGTLHISKQTVQCLEEVDGTSYSNHIFGEGPSPKLRIVRRALQKVLEPGTAPDLTRHSMSRLIYGAWLASNGREILQGSEVTPRYYFSPDLPAQAATDAIIEHWRQRWLSPRISRAEVRARISTVDSSAFLVSRDLPTNVPVEFAPIPDEAPKMLVSLSSADDSSAEWRDFVRALYRGRSAFADNMSDGLLGQLHIETSLDAAVLEVVASGKSVVLTGNPGDGKTHLLRVLQGRLEASAPKNKKPVIVLDASTVANPELKRRWSKAVGEGRPFCIAINEAVLKSLADSYMDFEPIQEAQRQVEQAIVYGEDPKAIRASSNVVVFDLSRRNVLSARVVTAVLDRLTNPATLRPCSKCPAEGCDLTANARLLRSPLVRTRLQVIFDRVSRRGYHATLRELLAFVSYLLFAGRSCDRLITSLGSRGSSLPNLPFLGRGGLFDVVRATFDPTNIAHPLWDEALVYAQTNAVDWVPEWPPEVDKLSQDNEERFASRKRAFFFCHKYGDDLLRIASDDESHFGRFLESSQREALRLIIRRINAFFGDAAGSDALRVWQSHRYNQSPRSILYSSSARKRADFEIVNPHLRPTMQKGFDLAQDHARLRLRANPAVSLRIDYPLFEMLAQAERGLPMMALDTDLTRRLWQFVEQLSEPDEQDEAHITVLDSISGERMRVTVDALAKSYLSVERLNGDDAYSD